MLTQAELAIKYHVMNKLSGYIIEGECTRDEAHQNAAVLNALDDGREEWTSVETQPIDISSLIAAEG